VMTRGGPQIPPKEVAFGTGGQWLVFSGSMVPWFVATALCTHSTWQGTAAISLPS